MPARAISALSAFLCHILNAGLLAQEILPWHSTKKLIDAGLITPSGNRPSRAFLRVSLKTLFIYVAHLFIEEVAQFRKGLWVPQEP